MSPNGPGSATCSAMRIFGVPTTKRPGGTRYPDLHRLLVHGGFLARAWLGAVLGEKRHDGPVLESLCSIESGAAIGGRDIEIDAELRHQLHGVECQGFALGALRLEPCSPSAAHSQGGHQSRRDVLSVPMGFAVYVISMVDEQGIGAAGQQKAHDVWLRVTGGQPEWRSSYQ